MPYPLEAFSDAFSSAFTGGLDRRQRQMMLEQELAARSQLAQQQAGLENNALTPELKLFNLWRQNPTAVRGFKEALDTNPTMPPAQVQTFQYLMQQPGMTQEKAMQLAFRPDLMSQMMGAMMGGGMGSMGAAWPSRMPQWQGGAPAPAGGGGFFGR